MRSGANKFTFVWWAEYWMISSLSSKTTEFDPGKTKVYRFRLSPKAAIQISPIAQLKVYPAITITWIRRRQRSLYSHSQDMWCRPRCPCRSFVHMGSSQWWLGRSHTYTKLLRVVPSPRRWGIILQQSPFDVLKTPQLSSSHYIPDDEIYLIDIGKNLFDFFRSFSDAKTGSKMHAILNLLWIDAVCINQDDPAEKEVQISLMGEIYSNAPPQIDTVVWMNDCLLPSLIQRKHPYVPLEAYMENVSKVNPGDAAFWLTNVGLQPKESD